MDSRQLGCGAVIYPSKIIPMPKGNVLHGLRRSDPGFVDFGEVYFSSVKQFEVKGWKKHLSMVMNLIVPIGEIMFYLATDLESEQIESLTLGESNYARLYVPPGIWVAFEGLGPHSNLLMNLASIEHDPMESIVREFVN